MKKIIIFVFVIFSISLLAQQTGTVQRERAIMRSGPGSIYEIIAELAKGSTFSILEEEDGWLNIKMEDLNGYVSQKVIQERKAADDIFAQMGTQKTTLRVSRHGMSAGVKGFAERFTRKFDGSPSFVDVYVTFQLNPKEYKYFRKETYKNLNRKKNYKNVLIPASKVKDYFSFPEEGLGIGIASNIASLGIYNDPALTHYVNSVGNIVVEATDVYDINYKFFILDTDKVNGYACPGGIVFITRGMMELVRTEAELACVLAHEIAHVARHHGMVEMEERKHHIMAEDAFTDMDEEMESMGIKQDKVSKEVEAEMEELCFEIFETVINGRLQAYEKEADELAVIFAARAGYNSRQFLTLLKRMKSSSSQSTNEHYTQEQIEKRIKLIKKAIIGSDLPDNLFDHKDRWERMGK
ncbi:MAG: M48 family metalloprotease [Candidatus Cloacimonetes bacterium]|nr:M48 family metalloprotease [Candidatus Cloacimonadota bacterium]